MKRCKLILIMSSERSGSNLLRKILSLHSKIFAPKAPHLLKTFLPLLRNVEIVEQEKQRVVFEGMKSIVNHPLHKWQLDIGFEEFVAEHEPKSVMDFFNGFYLKKFSQDAKKGHQFIACKENNLFDYADVLKEYYGDSVKIVYLYRDARDYAVSWMKVPGGLSTPEHAAKLWREEQEKCLAVAERYPVHFVKYEDLISQPERTIRDLFEFLSLPFEERCLMTDKAVETGTENAYWMNLNRPILKGNFGNYRGFFRASTILSIEELTLPYLIRLGYKRHYAGRFVPKLYVRLLQRTSGVFGQIRPSYKVADSTSETASVLADRMKLARQVRTMIKVEFHASA